MLKNILDIQSEKQNENENQSEKQNENEESKKIKKKPELKTSLSLCFSLWFLVPRAGIEPARPKAQDFESSASTSSATEAY